LHFHLIEITDPPTNENIPVLCPGGEYHSQYPGRLRSPAVDLKRRELCRHSTS
jgi:hypothetical protein